jgi:hypothetical protein
VVSVLQLGLIFHFIFNSEQRRVFQLVQYIVGPKLSKWKYNLHYKRSVKVFKPMTKQNNLKMADVWDMALYSLVEAD